MWPQVEQELAKLLSAKVFPALRGVQAYESLLKGGRPDPAACKAAAAVIVGKADLRSGIKEFGSREPLKVVEWSKPLCRAIGKYPIGPWWFDEELVQRWSRNYPPGTPNRKQMILDAMRPMLAVCNDWNDFTNLRIMRLSSPVPAISGQGAHMPIFSANSKDPAVQKLHDENKNVFFIGGYTQVFVPFVNPASTADYPF